MTSLPDWLHTPPGRIAQAWEQRRFDAAVVDIFGYNAMQFGLPQLHALAANRMPQRWQAVPAWPMKNQRMVARTEGENDIAVVADSAALPFDTTSLDLMALPHTLELSRDPRATLREVHRVLVHEGHVAITGFNPWGAWARREQRARLYRYFGVGLPYLPAPCTPIRLGRLKDWLLLLGFEIEQVQWGCYQPALRSARGLQRFDWLDRLGERRENFLGSLYFVLAVKRTPGVRLIGPAWKRVPTVAGAPASVARRHGQTTPRIGTPALRTDLERKQ